MAKWAAWAANVTGRSLPGGHFICEENPREVGESLLTFFERHAR
jgi:hypothetical protein